MLLFRTDKAALSYLALTTGSNRFPEDARREEERNSAAFKDFAYPLRAVFAWLLSMLLLCSKARRDHPKKTRERRIPLDHPKPIREAINPDKIGLDLSDCSDVVCVSWRNPNREVGRHCYESTLQYRNHCDTDWQVDKSDRKRRYYFRIRMRYDCLRGDLNAWSAWTPTRYWRNETETGSEDSSYPTSQTPNTPVKLSSVWTSLSVECETVDIEIVSTANSEEEEEEEVEREEGEAEEESTHIDPVAHLTDLGPQSYPNLEVNGIYVFW
ncbi:unnamed protein product [Coregonus sp. 'balchen']|nr:unnamed protein product [Coregonus sp. 'balchen']